MRVVIDANILFSALLKKGETRKICFDPEIELFAPEFLLEEFKKYIAYLRKKFSGDEKEFQVLVNTLTSQINFVSDSDLKSFVPAAASLIEDEKDWLYLACALRADAIIWSNDKHFKVQSRVKTFTTTEMIKNFGKL